MGTLKHTHTQQVKNGQECCSTLSRSKYCKATCIDGESPPAFLVLGAAPLERPSVCLTTALALGYCPCSEITANPICHVSWTEETPASQITQLFEKQCRSDIRAFARE